MANEPPRAPRLYVSARSGVDIRPLLDGLKQRGTDPYVLSDTALLGADLLQSVRIAVEGADLVIAVLGEEPSLNPIFEAGIAVALGKPLVLIAPPEAPIPSDLSAVVIARTSPHDLRAINFVLDQVQRRVGPVSHGTPAPTGRALTSQEVVRLQESFHPSIATGQSAVAILVEAIEASGGVAAVNTEGDSAFDIGVWSDDLDAIGANPLLVEVKRKLLPSAVAQVHRMLAAHPTARLALLVYLDPSSGRQALSSTEVAEARFPVLTISLQELIQRMGSASFAAVIRDMRNRSVHGLSAP